MFNNENFKELGDYLNDILNIPSPTGYTQNVLKYIKDKLNSFNVEFEETNKGALIIKFPGKSINKTRTFSAHVDTLGAMVKSIKDNGALSIEPIGGFIMPSIEGENCTVETCFGKSYTGTVHTIKPSVHIHGDECINLKRIPENMELILDEKVFSKEDTEKLGINVGDFICFEPRTTFTKNGFIKSRHLDDKASTAILLSAIKYLKDNNISLPYDTNFFISNYEEVGHGASSSIPKNTVEFISVDMGAPGLNQNSSEYCTCICAKDSSGPYDLELRKNLINTCIKNNIEYKIDIYPHYGSDASSALRAGWDIKTALIGPGVFASHSYERTHMDSILSTLNLIINYCLEK